MGNVGRGTQVEGSGRFPAARREESSISGARRVWEKLKCAVERLSGAHSLSELSVSDKTPIPASENDGNYRMACLRKMDGAMRALHGGNLFWEQDFETLMKRAKAGFDSKGDGSDHINQEICARMVGASVQIHQMGRLRLFVEAGGAKYLEWGAENLMLPEMRALCMKMLRAIARMSEPRPLS